MTKYCPICKQAIHALDDIVQTDNAVCYHKQCVELVPTRWMIIKKPTLESDPEPLGETSDNGMAAFELLPETDYINDDIETFDNQEKK